MYCIIRHKQSGKRVGIFETVKGAQRALQSFGDQYEMVSVIYK